MKQKILKILYKFLAFCARIYLMRTKPCVIWVTWSVGKTCCREIITQVLQQIQSEKIIYTSSKNYNSELGLIFSIFQIEEYNPSIKSLLKISWIIFKKSLLEKKQYDILVAEYGIDTPGDMDFLLSIMKPDIWIITKLDYVHSDNFPGWVEQYWGDKFKLVLASKKKIYFNAQDDFSLQHQDLLWDMYEKIFINTPKSHLQRYKKWLVQSFEYNKKYITINLLWGENIEYTTLALKIAEDLWIQLVQETYEFQYHLQAGRFSIFERNKNIFIDSTYNASPESMEKIIHTTQLVQKELYQKHKIIYILWDMREIWSARESAHQKLSQYIQDAVAIFTVWPDTYQYTIPALKSLGYQWEIHISLSAREIGKYLKKYLRENTDTKYIILFKGSQNTIFIEEALAAQLLPSQQKSLPRQSQDWKVKKDEFFRSL